MAKKARVKAIPRCLGSDGSDFGYRLADPELTAFIAEHHASSDATHLRYGRPVNEVYRALHKLTGQSFNHSELAHVSANQTDNPWQEFLKSELYYRSAKRWATWWEDHRHEFTGDARYSKVGLPEPVYDWANQEGFDLYGQSIETDSGASYAVRSIGTRVFVSEMDPPKLIKYSSREPKPIRFGNIVVDWEQEIQQPTFNSPGSYAFVTRENTIGLLEIGVEVTTIGRSGVSRDLNTRTPFPYLGRKLIYSRLESRQ